MSIYLIYSNTSQYESSNELLGYKNTESEAKAIVTTLKEHYTKAREFMDNVIEPAQKEYKKLNPPPVSPKHIDHPRWPSGIGQSDITQEMRDERQSIIDQNTKNSEAYELLYHAWNAKEKEYIQQFVTPVQNEPWFKKHLNVEGRYFFLKSSACGLVEGHEYIYERCEEIKS